MQNTQMSQTVIIVLAIAVAGLFLARYLSSSESRVAQEYVDSLSNNTVAPNNVTLQAVIKDLLAKINTLERDKIVHNDKIASLQHGLSMDREQTKYLTSNIHNLTSV